MTSFEQLPGDLFLDLDRSGPVPMYHQVAQRIEEAIESDALPAGSRLENEISLGQRLGVSRPTIRRAIQELVDKGLLVRRRGIGTQVVHGKIIRNVELTSLFDDLQKSGQQPTSQILSAGTGRADKNAAEMLGVEIGSPVLNLRRLRLANGIPVAVMRNILPEEFIELDADMMMQHGLYQILRGRGVAIRVAKQTIGARMASAEETELLDVSKGSPVLTMSRTAFDNSGRAIEFGQHSYRPDLYSFEVTLVDR